MNILTEFFSLDNALWALNKRDLQNFLTRAMEMVLSVPPERRAPGSKCPAEGLVFLIVLAGREKRAQDILDMATSRKTQVICIWQGKAPESTEQFLHFGVEAKTVCSFMAVVNLLHSCVQVAYREHVAEQAHEHPLEESDRTTSDH